MTKQLPGKVPRHPPPKVLPLFCSSLPVHESHTAPGPKNGSGCVYARGLNSCACGRAFCKGTPQTCPPRYRPMVTLGNRNVGPNGRMPPPCLCRPWTRSRGPERPVHFAPVRLTSLGAFICVCSLLSLTCKEPHRSVCVSRVSLVDFPTV